MTFPNYAQWLADVVHPRERLATRDSPWCFEHPDWHKHYRSKYEIAAALRPQSMLEIGVRFGYSAHAFLTACPWMVYVGVDSNNPEHNAMGTPTLDWAEEMLQRTIPRCGGVRTFVTMNTREQDLRTAVRANPYLSDIGTVDFVHVDADHSYHGALDDMTKAWDVCLRAMLIDDYAACASVKDAVNTFVRRSGATLLVSPSNLGEALLLKGTP